MKYDKMIQTLENRREKLTQQRKAAFADPSQDQEFHRLHLCIKGIDQCIQSIWNLQSQLRTFGTVPRTPHSYITYTLPSLPAHIRERIQEIEFSCAWTRGVHCFRAIEGPFCFTGLRDLVKWLEQNPA